MFLYLPLSHPWPDVLQFSVLQPPQNVARRVSSDPEVECVEWRKELSPHLHTTPDHIAELYLKP